MQALRYETRLALHWLFVPMLGLLFFHARRVFYVMGAFSLVWLLDYAYVFLFRTYRLAPGCT